MEKTALDKVLKTGQHLTLTYTVTSPTSHNGYTAIVDGTVVCEGFSTGVRRDVVNDADTPHVIQVPDIPGVKRQAGRFGAPVGLTTAEADNLDAVVAEVRAAPERRAAERATRVREAAPDAPTWKLAPTGIRPEVGDTREIDSRLVTIIGVRQTWTEDGPTFGLPTETGHIYVPTVRAATPAEDEEYRHQQTQQHDHDQRLTAALQNLKRLFVWDGNTDAVPDAEKATYHDAHSGATRLNLDYGYSLAITDDAIYAITTPTGGIAQPHPFWRHPVTPERVEVIAALAEHDPRVRVEQPLPRPVGRPKVGRQVTVTLPENSISQLDDLAEEQGRKRGQVLRDVVVDALGSRNA